MRSYERDGKTFALGGVRWVLSDRNVDGLVVSMTGPESIDEYLGASGWSSALDASTREVRGLRDSFVS
jgi:hypothetical protein